MIENKTLLITGGTGSFGREFTKVALKYNPEAIRIFSRGEYAQWEMEKSFNNSKLRFLIGDVRERERLKRAMQGVDIVVHAAALKQVPACEYNPIEAIRTNIDGSINVIDTALDSGVDKVLAISSDKAVHPINLYGATKLVMEKLFIQANVYVGTKFSCVRYGNFYGSRGSVLPLWQSQREKGEITLTQKEMTRFWITLENATEFAIDCLGKMEGGEIYIPKMPKRTLEALAYQVAPDAKLKIIGKRAGEKLHEALFAEGEEVHLTETDNCYIIKANEEVSGGKL